MNLLRHGTDPDIECSEAPQSPWEREPHRLWSLWDMIKVSARNYIELGEWIADARVTFELDEYFDGKSGHRA